MSVARKFAIAALVAAVAATALILAISLSYDPTPGGTTTDRSNDRNIARVVVMSTALSLPTLASIAAVVVDRGRRARVVRFVATGLALLGAAFLLVTGTLLFSPCLVLLLVSAAATETDQ